MDQQDSTSAAPAEDTDTSGQTTTSQATGENTRVYSQAEVDNMMAGLKGSLQKKLLKPYEELGDIDELRQLKQSAEQSRQEQALKRGEFDRILQELAEKKDAEIQRRDAVIQEYKIDTPLINTAAQHRSVNPEQVRSLLKNQVRLSDSGEVEVVSQDGSVRYTDAGRPMQVDQLVAEFLNANPHFVQPTPATTNSRSSISAPATGEVDITKLDMKNPEHRKVYAEYRRNNGLA